MPKGPDSRTPVVDFAVTSSNGAESVSSADLEVGLALVSAVDVTVDWTISGTATGAGTDYTLADGTLTIFAGNTTADIICFSLHSPLDMVLAPVRSQLSPKLLCDVESSVDRRSKRGERRHCRDMRNCFCLCLISQQESQFLIELFRRLKHNGPLPLSQILEFELLSGDTINGACG